ncbi:glycogen debranching N-terminal domain-containing protein [Georgenia sp. AZ-5]|uniref:glycogen debranching N-terminal domain-containing protein n=1 Tax=Georgenia sp. AZ-5 TaxID=3367526 RepID=UPI003755212D
MTAAEVLVRAGTMLLSAPDGSLTTRAFLAHAERAGEGGAGLGAAGLGAAPAGLGTPAGRPPDDRVPGRTPLGLFVADTRCLSVWALTVDGATLQDAGVRLGRSTRTLALVPATRRHVPPGFLLVRRQRVRAGGMTEVLTLRGLAGEEVRLAVVLHAATDFADPFELRADGRAFDLSGGSAAVHVRPDALEMTYARRLDDGAFTRRVRVRATGTAEIASGIDLADGAVGGRLGWVVTLAPGEVREVRVEVDVDAPAEEELDAGAHPPAERRPHPPAERGPATAPAPETAEPAAAGPAGEPFPSGAAARLPGAPLPHDPAGDRTDPGDLPADPVDRLRAQGLADLDALVMPCPTQPELAVPAAGVPWFLTFFGRDAVLAALLAHQERPALLPGVVQALARTQGTGDEAARGEQPGKVVHELRVSELAVLGQVPFLRYYGAVDTTALYLVALGRLGAHAEPLLRTLKTSARAAVAWLRGPGGLDEHGFVRYVPDPAGLHHQGWKDSADGVVHADGRPAEGAIALCEVQGYTWRALVETVRLARALSGDSAWADELEAAAGALRQRFRERFWLQGAEFPALALDGAGRQVDALASNAGHLLWTGMLSHAEAALVVERLMSPAFFTGFGLRTLAAGQPAYSPLSYHRGAVWPHDTVLAALGMQAYGFTDEAHRLAAGLLRAAEPFGGHLPELFGGNTTADFPGPLTHARAAVPQAWAAAAGVAAARLLKA